TKQCAGADRGKICIVYIQVSPLSVIHGNRRVPTGNHWPGPSDRQVRLANGGSGTLYPEKQNHVYIRDFAQPCCPPLRNTV
ncbi:unnamed protein product, partial [Staurois parvus]